MDIRRIIKSILSETVTGNPAADAGGRATVASEKARDILASMGVRTSDLDHIFTIDQLKVEPFKLEFVIQKTIDKPQELTLPETEEFSGLAKVKSDSKNLVLLFKPSIEGELSDKIFTIEFLSDELITNLTGTKEKVKALVAGSKGKFYHIRISKEFLDLYNKFDNVEEPEEREELKKSEEPEESEDIKQVRRDLEFLKTSGGFDKQGEKFPQGVISKLIKQKEKELDNLIQKNKKRNSQQLGIPFPESFKIANDLILEDKDKTTEYITLEIYLSNIELGIKGKSKKRGDYSRNGGKGKFYHVHMDNNVNYPIGGNIKSDVKGLPTQIENIINVNLDKKNCTIKKSAKPNSIILSKDKHEYLFITSKEKNPNWFKPGLPVIIGDKAFGKSNVGGFDAILNLKSNK